MFAFTYCGPISSSFPLFVLKSPDISVFTDDREDDELSEPDYVSWKIC